MDESGINNFAVVGVFHDLCKYHFEVNVRGNFKEFLTFSGTFASLMALSASPIAAMIFWEVTAVLLVPASLAE